MNKDDKILKDFINEGLEKVHLSEDQRENLILAMNRQLKHEKQSPIKRLVQKLFEFMNTTYEISLTPVVTALGVVVISAGILGYGFLNQLADRDRNVDQLIYIQKTVVNPDGNIHIVYTPVEQRGGRYVENKI